jgi:hypothetical protein
MRTRTIVALVSLIIIVAWAFVFVDFISTWICLKYYPLAGVEGNLGWDYSNCTNNGNAFLLWEISIPLMMSVLTLVLAAYPKFGSLRYVSIAFGLFLCFMLFLHLTAGFNNLGILSYDPFIEYCNLYLLTNFQSVSFIIL